MAYVDAELGTLLSRHRSPPHGRRRHRGSRRSARRSRRAGSRVLLYDATLHVPLIVAGAGARRRASSTEQVRSVDIAPTIAATCRALTATDDPSIGGESLRALLRRCDAARRARCRWRKAGIRACISAGASCGRRASANGSTSRRQSPSCTTCASIARRRRTSSAIARPWRRGWRRTCDAQSRARFTQAAAPRSGAAGPGDGRAAAGARLCRHVRAGDRGSGTENPKDHIAEYRAYRDLVQSRAGRCSARERPREARRSCSVW